MALNKGALVLALVFACLLTSQFVNAATSSPDILEAAKSTPNLTPIWDFSPLNYPQDQPSVWQKPTSGLKQINGWSSPIVEEEILYIEMDGTHTYKEIRYNPDSLMNEEYPVTEDWDRIYALNVSTGKQYWASLPLYALSSTSGLSSTPLAMGDGRIFVEVTGERSGVNAFNISNGKVLWNYTLNDYKNNVGSLVSPIINTRLAYYEDKVIFGVDRSKIFALNATVGTQIWNFTFDGHMQPFSGAPAISKGIVTFGLTGGSLGSSCLIYALNASTGNKVWSYTLEDSFIDFVIPSNNAVYVINGNNSVLGEKVAGPRTIHSIDIVKGTQNWECTEEYFPGSRLYGTYFPALYGSYCWNLWITSPVTVDSRAIYLDSNKQVLEANGTETFVGNICALDTKTGATLWNNTLDNYVSSPPIINNGAIYVFVSNSALLALNPYSGEIVAKFTDIPGIGSMIGLIDDVIYFDSNDKVLRAFKLPETPPIPTPTLTLPPEGSDPRHLEPIDYLLPISVIVAVVVTVSVLLYGRHRKTTNK